VTVTGAVTVDHGCRYWSYNQNVVYDFDGNADSGSDAAFVASEIHVLKISWNCDHRCLSEPMYVYFYYHAYFCLCFHVCCHSNARVGCDDDFYRDCPS
jgi:hypothetical protein